MDDTLRLFLVGNDPLARAGLVLLLREQTEYHIIGQASSNTVNDLPWDELCEEQPDLILWDLGWETAVSHPLPDPTDLPAPILALLADPADADAVWRSGARGLLPRQFNGDSLLAAIPAVATGLAVYDPTLLPNLATTTGGEETAVDLTPREAEVLQLMAEGLTNKAIAQQLDISSHTVKFHVTAIMSKLHAQSRTEAVVQATRQGLILL